MWKSSYELALEPPSRKDGTVKPQALCALFMSVELPVSPVDDIIRRHANGLRVSAEAAEELAHRIQTRGASLAIDAAKRAAADDRKTIQAADCETERVPSKRDLTLPIAPVDRIARLEIDDRYRISMDARIALADELETFAEEVAIKAAILARHAGRRTIQAEDIRTYFQLLE